MRKAPIILNVVGLALIIGAVFAYSHRGTIRSWIEDRQKIDLPASVSAEDVANRNTNSSNINSPTPNTQLPSSFDLDVPFTTQAPGANWDEVHEEACEEAAALMVHFFHSQQTFTSVSQEDAELMKIIDYENRIFGDYKDTTAAQTAEFIRGLWGYKTVRLIHDPTIEQIKREVYAGHPVIVPAAGRLLGNPNFKSPGPLYHNLVIRGWTKDGTIITNDPGTRKGERYVYDPDVLMNAMHDWNGGDVTNGEKVVIVVEPNQ